MHVDILIPSLSVLLTPDFVIFMFYTCVSLFSKELHCEMIWSVNVMICSLRFFLLVCNFFFFLPVSSSEVWKLPCKAFSKGTGQWFLPTLLPTTKSYSVLLYNRFQSAVWGRLSPSLHWKPWGEGGQRSHQRGRYGVAPISKWNTIVLRKAGCISQLRSLTFLESKQQV